MLGSEPTGLERGFCREVVVLLVVLGLRMLSSSPWQASVCCC